MLKRKKVNEFTLERALNVLKGPVLKMTLFLWQKMKATIPITTSSRNRGVRTAMIHRLSGGVFTTAESRQGHLHPDLLIQMSKKMLLSIFSFCVAVFKMPGSKSSSRRHTPRSLWLFNNKSKSWHYATILKAEFINNVWDLRRCFDFYALGWDGAMAFRHI